MPAPVYRPQPVRRNRRQSYTAPGTPREGLKPGRTPIEASVTRTMTTTVDRWWETTRTTQAATVVGGIMPSILPPQWRFLNSLLSSAFTDALTEEVLQSGAWAWDEAWRGLGDRTVNASSMVGEAQRTAHARSDLAGVPYPSQRGYPLPPNLPPVPPSLGSLFAGSENPRVSYLHLRLDLVNPFAVEYAATAAYNLAGRVTAQAEQAIRNTITHALNGGLTPEQAFHQIDGVIGLHPRWQAAVDRYGDGLRARGADEDWVAGQVQRYGDRLRFKRAQMIARTETMRAANMGRLASWDAIGATGLIDVNTWTKEWMTGPKVEQSKKVNRGVTGPCWLCSPLDEKTVVGTKGLFTLGNGRQVLAPPAHPHCRCVVVLVPPEPMVVDGTEGW